MDMQLGHGNAAQTRRCSIEMDRGMQHQHGHARFTWTCSVACTRSMDMGMRLGHEARTRTCRGDMNIDTVSSWTWKWKWMWTWKWTCTWTSTRTRTQVHINIPPLNCGNSIEFSSQIPLSHKIKTIQAPLSKVCPGAWRCPDYIKKSALCRA